MALPTDPIDGDPRLDAQVAARDDPADERELVRAVLAGSEEAWRRFLQRYSGLIQAMVRRYLGPRDHDEVGAVYLDVLESLYRRKLALYEGRASLSTWLTLVARSQVLDHLRHRFGRRHLPGALRRLPATERDIFRLYYIEGRRFADVLHALQAKAPAWTETRLCSALHRIETRIGSRWLRRLAYDLHAQSTGAASGRLVAYLDHVREEFRLNQGAHSPDYYLMEREAQAVVERLRAILAGLPPEERRILSLRFERGWSARRIAEELGLSGPRGAYTVLDRIVRGLRRRMGAHEAREP
jgi:RNA polymerase sigma factor (sigma-70 family)